MSQLTIYLAKPVEEQVKREAKRSKMSLSAYIAQLAAKKSGGAQWPVGFARLAGSWKGAFPKIEDPIPEDASELP